MSHCRARLLNPYFVFARFRTSLTHHALPLWSTSRVDDRDRPEY